MQRYPKAAAHISSGYVSLQSHCSPAVEAEVACVVAPAALADASSVFEVVAASLVPAFVVDSSVVLVVVLSPNT